MTTWLAVAAVLVAAAAVGVWRWRMVEPARQAQHDNLLDQIFAADANIADLEACWQLPAHQPDHR